MMDTAADRRYAKRMPLGTLIWGGKHARPLIRVPRAPSRGEGTRTARTAARILRRVRRRFVSVGALLLTAALVVGVSPSFRHYLQDMNTQELLSAARAGESRAPLNISLSDYVSSDAQEAPVLNAAAETILDEMNVPAAPLAAPAAPESAETSASAPEDTGGAPVSTTTTTTTTTRSSSSSSSSGGANAGSSRAAIETLGVMEISAIGLEMPIAEGAGTSELRYALGHHPSTPALGTLGYSTVFGHRMYNYGRHFNRLDELVPGDEVYVTVGGERLRYIVDEKRTMLPEEVPFYMMNTSNRARLILATCTPVRVATHRLLVFCTLDRDRTEGPIPVPYPGDNTEIL